VRQWQPEIGLFHGFPVLLPTDPTTRTQTTDAGPLLTFSTCASSPLCPAVLHFSTAAGGGGRDAAGDGGDDDDGVAVGAADDGDDYVGASSAEVASAVAVDLLDLDVVYFRAADPPLLCARVSHALCPTPRRLCYNQKQIFYQFPKMTEGISNIYYCNITFSTYYYNY